MWVECGRRELIPGAAVVMREHQGALGLQSKASWHGEGDATRPPLALQRRHNPYLYAWLRPARRARAIPWNEEGPKLSRVPALER